MTPERFRQLELLYHAARDGDRAARESLLAKADPEMRRAVESLLAQPAGERMPDRPPTVGPEAETVRESA